MQSKQDHEVKKHLDMLTKYLRRFYKPVEVAEDDHLVLVKSRTSNAQVVAWKSTADVVQDVIDAAPYALIIAEHDALTAIERFRAFAGCPSTEEIIMKLAIAGE